MTQIILINIFAKIDCAVINVVLSTKQPLIFTVFIDLITMWISFKGKWERFQ